MKIINLNSLLKPKGLVEFKLQAMKFAKWLEIIVTIPQQVLVILMVSIKNVKLFQHLQLFVNQQILVQFILFLKDSQDNKQYMHGKELIVLLKNFNDFLWIKNYYD